MAMLENHEVSGAAGRMRRYRERKRLGVVCVVQVPIYCRDVETFVARARLEPDHQKDTAKIAEVIEALVDDFTEGKLIATSI